MRFSEIFGNMGSVGWCVVGVLLSLSVYSIGVMIEKFHSFRAAKSQSQRFLPTFARCMKQGRLKEAIETSRNHRRSHLAKVVSAGITEFVSDAATSPNDANGRVEAAARALDRATMMTSAEMKKGLGGLATIGSTAPFIGLFGTVVGIIHAFQGIADSESGGLAAVSGGIAEALIATAFGLFVAIPAVMAFNYFTGQLERLQVEMAHSSAELLDFFLKRTETRHAGG